MPTAQQMIALNSGTTANDGTGDTLRSAANKINMNFTYLFAWMNSATTSISGLRDLNVFDPLVSPRQVVTKDANGVPVIYPQTYFKNLTSISGDDSLYWIRPTAIATGSPGRWELVDYL